MSQTVAKMIRIAPGKYLCLCFEAPEGPRMNHAVAVALKNISIKMRGLGIAPAARLLHMHGVVGQHGKSLNYLNFKRISVVGSKPSDS